MAYRSIFKATQLMAFSGLMLMASGVRAAHIIGGELYYDYMGNDQYQVTLKLYRDCFSSGAAFDAQGRITVFTGDGAYYAMHAIPYPGSTFVPIELDSPCLTLPPNLCVETTSYTQLIMLPANSTGYILSFQRCCREPSVVNIIDPGSVGLTCTVRVPPLMELDNSSARFNTLPPAALCLNEPYSFDHSASDPDGDELVYSLVTPLNGASQGNPYPVQSDPPPYALIPWSDGFSENYQMDSSPPLSINPSSGEITVHPSAIGNYVIGVSVKEYRNGVLLSETIRDYRFSIVPCDAAVNAAILPQQPSQFCAGLEMTFTNGSSGATEYFWDFGDGNTVSDTSSATSPTWTYAEPGVYTITLIANPGVVCADTAQVVFNVFIDPVPTFIAPEPTCGSVPQVLVAGGSFGPNATFSWDLGQGATPPTATGPEASAIFAVGVHPVTLNVIDNGCGGEYTADVIVYPVPIADFTVAPESPQLAGTVIGLTSQSNPNGSTIPPNGYTWTVDGLPLPDNTSDVDWAQTVPGWHALQLVITTTDGCTDTISGSYEIIAGEVVIPNVFTPNNDGNNDFFVIEYAQFLPNDLRIYNRWGMAVYEATNYQNNWRGTDLPDGTYYYIFSLRDGKEYAGHVTLLR